MVKRPWCIQSSQVEVPAKRSAAEETGSFRHAIRLQVSHGTTWAKIGNDARLGNWQHFAGKRMWRVSSSVFYFDKFKETRQHSLQPCGNKVCRLIATRHWMCGSLQHAELVKDYLWIQERFMRWSVLEETCILSVDTRNCDRCKHLSKWMYGGINTDR